MWITNLQVCYTTRIEYKSIQGEIGIELLAGAAN